MREREREKERFVLTPALGLTSLILINKQSLKIKIIYF